MDLLNAIENNVLLTNIANSNLLAFIFIFMTLTALSLPILLKGKKKFIYSIRSYKLIGNLDNLNDFKILYKNKEVNNLIVSKVAFWNKGRVPIRKDDIAKADPIRFFMDGGSKIYNVRIIKENKANNLKINWPKDEEDNFVNIAFDYLGNSDGGIIEIVHTDDTLRKLKVIGSLIGCKRLINNKYIYISPSESRPLVSIKFERISLAFVFLIFALLFTFWYFVMFKVASFNYYDYYTIEDINFEMKTVNRSIFLLLFLSPVIPFFFYISYILLFKSRVPRGFEEFEKK